jgi:hypothetical protein
MTRRRARLRRARARRRARAKRRAVSARSERAVSVLLRTS